MEPIRVFIGGSTPEHDLPTSVLEFSIRRHTAADVSIHRLHECPIRVPVAREAKNRPVTSFSFQRFLIPEWCGFAGRAIYLDSDQVVLSDIADLWKTVFPPGMNVLNTGGWQSAVMLIDCNTAHWRISEFVDALDAGRVEYKRLMNLRWSPFRLAGALDPNWNCMDTLTEDTCLLHYTGMATQPWLFQGHPHGNVWEHLLVDGIQRGEIDRDLVLQAIEAEQVRPSLAYLIGERPIRHDSAFVPPHNKRSR